MNIAILTNEYPPDVYGGAGVHVEYLTRELSKINKTAVQVLAFGEQTEQQGDLGVRGIKTFNSPTPELSGHEKFLKTVFNDVVMAGNLKQTDIVHCHTWYTHLAGLLVKQLHQVPLVLTTHSLEPHRPWKIEQLGTGYYGSSWIERTAYENADGIIAVSESMKHDVMDLYGVKAENVEIIHNGIDPGQYRHTQDKSVLQKYGIDEGKPYLLFVGRITRQKGIIHLVNAIKYINRDVQVVLCAGMADTEEIQSEMEEKVADARSASGHPIIWIPQMLDKSEIIPLYSMAEIFLCPSVYEPFGIINLEAMACETPVIASRVGGIPEIIVEGETGFTVPIETGGESDTEPKDPDRFSRAFAEQIDRLLADPGKITDMGRRSRKRVEDHFSWRSIAQKTRDFYQTLSERKNKK